MPHQDESHSAAPKAQSRTSVSGLSSDAGGLSELKALRRRERLIEFLRGWWAPIASALAGAFLGGVAGYETDGPVEDSQTVYPFAVATAALAQTNPIASGRRSLLISIVTLTFILSFLAGIAAGDSLNDVDQFSNSVRYGVAREHGK
ncbi:TPA: hypothetical protein HA259_01155 [Thermoplasmata archaeon]|nr:hypothetical protein [Thermoplasmata archaeon]